MMVIANTQRNLRMGKVGLHIRKAACRLPGMDLRWDDLRVFLELYRGRTLAKAAKRLGLDVSTLSRRLAGLEQALDVSLFDRTRAGLVPTRAAEQLVPSAQAMEQAALEVESASDRFEREVEGVVRLAAAPGMVEAFLSPVLSSLLERYPKLRFEIDASTRVADLVRREADLAIRSIRPKSGDLVMTKITSARWVAMASPAVANRLGVVDEWTRVPWVTWGGELAQLAPARWLAKHVAAEPVLRTNSLGLQVAAVEAGLGVALLPEPYQLAAAVAPLRLSRKLEVSARGWPTEELWLVAARSVRDVPRVAAAWDALAAWFHQWPPQVGTTPHALRELLTR